MIKLRYLLSIYTLTLRPKGERDSSSAYPIRIYNVYNPSPSLVTAGNPSSLPTLEVGL